MQLTSPPLAPKTLTALQQLGIHTAADLQAVSAVKAFLLLKAAGCTLTRSTLWQLAALNRNSTPQALSEADKAALLEAVRAHPPVALFPPPQEMAQWMRLALQQAEQAAARGEIPVGAVVVRQGQLVAAAHNRCISDHNISHHAEICALAAAGEVLQNYRLDGCDVYITLEPCNMCAAALIQARVRRVVFGAAEPKTGAAGSVTDLFADRRLNQHTAVTGGILAAECETLLLQFFRHKRRSDGLK